MSGKEMSNIIMNRLYDGNYGTNKISIITFHNSLNEEFGNYSLVNLCIKNLIDNEYIQSNNKSEYQLTTKGINLISTGGL